ncbi:MAG: IS30 family transposase, partial [Patescibacteria group bacterium]
TDFNRITDNEIKTVENILNNRPRKRLGYKTPLEVFNESVAVKG